MRSLLALASLILAMLGGCIGGGTTAPEPPIETDTAPVEKAAPMTETLLEGTLAAADLLTGTMSLDFTTDHVFDALEVWAWHEEPGFIGQVTFDLIAPDGAQTHYEEVWGPLADAPAGTGPQTGQQEPVAMLEAAAAGTYGLQVKGTVSGDLHVRVLGHMRQFTEATYLDLDDLLLHGISEHNGTVRLLDLMSEACDACKLSMPSLGSIYNDYKDRITMVSINVETTETLQDTRNVRDQNQAGWTFGQDYAGTTVEQFNVTGLPTFVILDAHGRQTFSSDGWTVGGGGSEDELRAALDEALASSA